MIKLHLFSGWANPRLGITENTPLGHLYSATGNVAELLSEGARIGLREEWLQRDVAKPGIMRPGLDHFDLWGSRLKRAKELFPTVSTEELGEDMKLAGTAQSGQDAGDDSVGFEGEMSAMPNCEHLDIISIPFPGKDIWSCTSEAPIPEGTECGPDCLGYEGKV